MDLFVFDLPILLVLAAAAVTLTIGDVATQKKTATTHTIVYFYSNNIRNVASRCS
jgi:hypothetical protein